MSREPSVHPGFDAEPIDRNLKRVSSVLKAMSNQHRLRILCELLSGEKSVGVNALGLIEHRIKKGWRKSLIVPRYYGIFMPMVYQGWSLLKSAAVATLLRE